MAAVIRVKRHIEEEPLNAFVLNCKRRKVEEIENDEETSTILKFAGTVNCQDDFMKVTKKKAEQIITKVRKPDLITKSRDTIKNNSQLNRFKIVNCSRPINFNEEGKITVVDIEKQLPEEVHDEEHIPSTSNVTTHQTTDEDYVYDVYLPDSGTETNSDDNLIENLLSVQPFELIYDHRSRINSDDSDDESSDNSNSENNWRNDYPDSDNSIGIDDIRNAVENIGMSDEDGDSSRSSEDDEYSRNGFINTIDVENDEFDDDVDYCDVNLYGDAYARYKARVIKPTLKDDSNEEVSDLDDYYD